MNGFSGIAWQILAQVFRLHLGTDQVLELDPPHISEQKRFCSESQFYLHVLFMILKATYSLFGLQVLKNEYPIA